ncbi:zinc finger protein constans-like [Anaeramoeba flamelloides]|uniref:Zinc finger protein constans-like n=1 Tax=Anaeramoeba flamelloides TaxID=1746091 RepID=A0AAV8AC70_9EUKA|nr:zinc finger protein constans-like [Anaeramoeba flamelloides]
MIFTNQSLTKVSTFSKVRPISRKAKPNCQNCLELIKYVLASIQCNNCSQFLCTDCNETIHQNHSFKNHYRIPLKKKAKKEIELKQENYCGSCLQVGHYLVPTTYCVNCNTFLCGICSHVIHSVPLFSNHVSLDVKEKIKKTKSKQNKKLLCDGCLINGVNRVSKFYCNDCRSMLCVECSNLIHTLPSFKNHVFEHIQPSLHKPYKIGQTYEQDIKSLKSFRKEIPEQAEKNYNLVENLLLQMEMYKIYFMKNIIKNGKDHSNDESIKEQLKLVHEINFHKV